MEQIYQVMWVILIASVTLNAVTFYVAPHYICVAGNCPDDLIDTARFGVYDLDATKTSLTSTVSGATSGSTPTTPTGFWGVIAGAFLGGGLINTVIVPIVTFGTAFQTTTMYYANQLDIKILKDIVMVFVFLWSVIQMIGIAFFVIYIAGLVRGVKA